MTKVVDDKPLTPAEAVAVLEALVDGDLLVIVATHLDRLARDRAHGGLTVELCLRDGRVESSNITPRTHWRRASPLDNARAAGSTRQR